MRTLAVITCATLALVSLRDTGASALDGDILFKGFPIHKVVIDDIQNPQVSAIPNDQQQEFRVEIAVRGKGYEWASRENKKLLYAGRSGLFETWIAENGSGYIRIAPVAAEDPKAEPTQYIYVEHLVNKLGSITYWGRGYLSR